MNHQGWTKIFLFIVPFLSIPFFTNCAVFLFDEKVDAVVITSKTLDNFSGLYETNASYYSANSLGVSVSNTFDDYNSLGLRQAEYINIKILNNQDLIIVGIRDGCPISELTLIQNINFYFKDGVITLGDLSRFKPPPGDPGGAGVGIGYDRTKWIIDDDRNLVVVHKTGVVGLACLIPVVAAGKGMAIYERIDISDKVLKYNVNCF